MNKVLNDFKEKIFKYKYFIMSSLLIIFVMIITIIYFINKTENKSVIKTTENIDSVLAKTETIIEEEKEKIFVDIKGYVNKPGVYELNLNSRVVDLITIAGGLKKGSNTRFVNLAKVLEDGEVVVIYSDEEIKEAKKKDTIAVNTPCICEEIKNDACYLPNDSSGIVNGKININTASLSQLMTLSGIGESKAQAIIDYRTNNGLFKSIEDIVNVSGISDTTYAKIKENITV
ncbi:MAG: competence protein ComE [Tenericutes bacterium]|nr:competence protein ComE [Mycoplasmatota bacterium]